MKRAFVIVIRALLATACVLLSVAELLEVLAPARCSEALSHVADALGALADDDDPPDKAQ